MQPEPPVILTAFDQGPEFPFEQQPTGRLYFVFSSVNFLLKQGAAL
jgi:hypothetical protein